MKVKLKGHSNQAVCVISSILKMVSVDNSRCHDAKPKIKKSFPKITNRI